MHVWSTHGMRGAEFLGPPRETRGSVSQVQSRPRDARRPVRSHSRKAADRPGSRPGAEVTALSFVASPGAEPSQGERMPVLGVRGAPLLPALQPQTPPEGAACRGPCSQVTAPQGH